MGLLPDFGRVTGLVVGDLETEERVEGLEGFGIGRRHSAEAWRRARVRMLG
jgi:hypothetical protein